MTYNYKCTTNTIWLSFDYGTVEADSIKQARQKAIKELKYNVDKANVALNYADITQGFRIDIDYSQVEVTELKTN